MMKAKYGKFSIVFFISIWVVSFCFAPEGNDQYLAYYIVGVYFLPSFIGLILAIQGIRKKESPKIYSLIGLMLNSLIFIIPLVFGLFGR